MNTISKVYLGTNVKSQNPLVMEADPCGLIRSFVLNPPRGGISPKNVFLRARISNGSCSNLEAAREVIRALGESMSQSNSEWLKELLCLFYKLTGSEFILPHSNPYSSSAR